MKSNNVNRIILAWFLSVIFIFPYVARSFHIYQNQNECCSEFCSHSEDNHHQQHDCNTCPVCQFALSSFTEIDFYKPDDVLAEFCQPLVSFCQTEKYDSVTYLNYLRAPPVV